MVLWGSADISILSKMFRSSPLEPLPFALRLRPYFEKLGIGAKLACDPWLLVPRVSLDGSLLRTRLLYKFLGRLDYVWCYFVGLWLNSDFTFSLLAAIWMLKLVLDSSCRYLLFSVDPGSLFPGTISKSDLYWLEAPDLPWFLLPPPTCAMSLLLR